MRRSGGIFFAIFILIVAAFAFYVWRESRALRYSIVFDQGKGVKTGDTVALNGVDIGKVNSVDLTGGGNVKVEVRVDPDHADAVRMNSTAIVREAPPKDGEARAFVEVINIESDSPAPPLAKGSEVRGVNSQLDLEAKKLGGTLRLGAVGLSQALSMLSVEISQLGKTFDEFAKSPETRQAIDDLNGFIRQMNVEGRRAAQALNREWPRLQQELERSLKDLQQEGRTRIADRIRKAMGQIDRTLEEWETQPSPPDETPFPAETPPPATTPTE